LEEKELLYEIKAKKLKVDWTLTIKSLLRTGV